MPIRRADEHLTEELADSDDNNKNKAGACRIIEPNDLLKVIGRETNKDGKVV